MIWFVLAATLTVGYTIGRATAVRRCAALLRDACHYDAAALIDNGRGDAS